MTQEFIKEQFDTKPVDEAIKAVYKEYLFDKMRLINRIYEELQFALNGEAEPKYKNRSEFVEFLHGLKKELEDEVKSID